MGAAIAPQGEDPAIPSRRQARYVGQPIPRVEDRRLITGAGRYTDDLRVPGQLHAVFVRSPHAHAAIGAIDVADAVAAPGVAAVLTARDYRADGLKPVGHRATPAGAVNHKERAFGAGGDATVIDLPHWPLAEDRVRHVGEPIAVVVAETLAQAQDAAERVAVDYRPLPAVTMADAAIAPDAPLLWDAAPGNICVDERFGPTDDVAATFATAALTVRWRFHNGRIVNCQMEPRAVIGAPGDDGLTVIAGSQGVMRHTAGLREIMDLPEDGIRVICPDVGGGFGPRSFVYPEIAAVAWAAKRLGRPVGWTSDRSEAFQSDYQGRDLILDARLALDADGRFLALDVDLVGNVGAHTVAFVPMANASRILTTVYDIPIVGLRVRGVLTNTVPTAPYRGAGRPEATFALERLIDMAARRGGFDRIELRRRNMVRRDQLPYRNAMGLTYDSGDFHGNLDHALDLAGWDDADARRRDAGSRGRLLGIGVANYIESPVGDPRERVELAVNADGTVDLVTGTQSTGQGHETSFAQVAADMLQVPFDAIRLRGGDSRIVSMGGGTHSDRSMRIAGTLILQTADKVVDQARAVCARLWDVAADAIAYEDGLFRNPQGNQALSLFEVAGALDPNADDKLAAATDFVGRIPAHPTGCAVCEVEIDPETGVVEITRYSSVDDVGRVVNPLIVDGQVHGGIAQGVGEALTERVVHDPGVGPAADRLLPRLRSAARRPAAQLPGRATRGPDPGQPARHQGRRRGRHHPGGRGDHQRRGRRARRPRRRAYRDPGDTGARVARLAWHEGLIRSGDRFANRCRNADTRPTRTDWRERIGADGAGGTERT